MTTTALQKPTEQTETVAAPLDRRLSVAPMMDRTDRHDRYFLRQISPSALLYTEMITTGAILHGDRDRFLKFDPAEHPVALQLGGADPEELARCAVIAAERGYDEVNLNVGCPSDRVQNAQFGACLMNHPDLVAACVARMIAEVDIPVTVKTRIGVDDRDSWEEFRAFVETVAAAGCDVFIIHARKAWLQGLSPKENREIPPLSYETVYRLKQTFPELAVVINGGITKATEIEDHLAHVDGVMIGPAGKPARRPAGLSALYRAGTGPGRAALRHGAPCAGAVPGTARRPGMATAYQRKRSPPGRRQRRAAGRRRPCRRDLLIARYPRRLLSGIGPDRRNFLRFCDSAWSSLSLTY